MDCLVRWIEFLVTVMDNIDVNKGRGRFLHFFLAVSANKSWLNSVSGIFLLLALVSHWLEDLQSLQHQIHVKVSL
jgi:hypothetical protein